MSSELGQMIRKARLAQGLGLREFAKIISKSPSFVTQLECEDEVPKVAEETLQSIAERLQLNLDALLVFARRTPQDVVPSSPLEVAMYRKMKGLTTSQQQRVGDFMESLKPKPRAK